MKRPPLVPLVTAVVCALVLGSGSAYAAAREPDAQAVTAGRQAATGHPERSGERPVPHESREAAEGRLRSDAESGLRVRRDPRGIVEFVATRDGTGVDNPTVGEGLTPGQVAVADVRRYGEMFGLRPDVDDTVVTKTLPERDGGSVVTLQQQTGGVPVLGGEVVLSLDGSGGLRSALADISTARPVPDRPGVAETAAAETALAATAKSFSVRPRSLRVGRDGLWLYDPAVLGVTDPLGAREVWRFEVGNRADISELVLVDATTGAVALRFDQVTHALRRAVCDVANRRQSTDHPCRKGFARREGGRRSPVTDVNDAFAHSKATYDTYKRAGGVDLTRLIGRRGADGVRRITATVRWCFVRGIDARCPMRNAFWNGRQIYLGKGFAAADDVVAHELTHGFVQRTARLMPFHQSGAINESLADVMGEIVDHRYNPQPERNSAWIVGERLPDGFQRNMRRPTASRRAQPDRMTSAHWWPDNTLRDSGGIHVNSGVGNKTAYLISQGGTFNGHTVKGIDRSDPRLTRTARLYIGTMRRLTSGSDYADLGRVLSATCTQLATSGTAGFGDETCAAVNEAILATELADEPRYPAARTPEAPADCPVDTVKEVLYADDLESRAHPYDLGRLWLTAPHAWLLANATSGERSLFGFDPDPSLGDPASSAVSMGRRVGLPEGQSSFLHFTHWRLLEWLPGSPARYFDGGFVRVRDAGAGGPWQDTAARPWVNGPKDRIRLGYPATGFGGDSHGYVSSRLDLSHLAGREVQAQWQVRGDRSLAYLGWYVDDITIYTCTQIDPAATTG